MSHTNLVLVKSIVASIHLIQQVFGEMFSGDMYVLELIAFLKKMHIEMPLIVTGKNTSAQVLT